VCTSNRLERSEKKRGLAQPTTTCARTCAGEAWGIRAGTWGRKQASKRERKSSGDGRRGGRDTRATVVVAGFIQWVEQVKGGPSATRSPHQTTAATAQVLAIQPPLQLRYRQYRWQPGKIPAVQPSHRIKVLQPLQVALRPLAPRDDPVHDHVGVVPLRMKKGVNRVGVSSEWAQAIITLV